jgi:hypothetical protein
VAEGLTRIYELFTSFVAVGGAQTLDGGMGAGILVLLGIIPNDLVVRLCPVGSKAGLTQGQVLYGLQSKQVLPEPDK